MRILLVEDAKAIAAVMAARLSSFGYQVSIAEHGRKAVDWFARSSFDLVLMDVDMPVMGGFEATREIRAHEASKGWAWTPILFLTASDTQENLVAAIEAGGDDFISKSASEVVLQAKMKAMSRISALRQQLMQANAHLAEEASRDGLTGLFNRRQMDRRVDILWDEACRSAAPFALLMVDIDHFKKYNDHYGHQGGDDCLRAMARVILRAVDVALGGPAIGAAFVARYGGEEFAVILPAGEATLFERVATAIVDAVRLRGIEHAKSAEWGVVTVSIGGARTDRAGGRIGELFRLADRRLYQAKSLGRNRAELADAPNTQAGILAVERGAT